MVAQKGAPSLTGRPSRLTMYLATLDCATSNPSLSSSPWIRGAPHSGFSMLIRRTSARRSASICGRPPPARFPTPVTAKAGPMPTHQCLGLDDRENIQNRRKPSIQLDKRTSGHCSSAERCRAPCAAERSTDVGAPHFGFKSALRLEWCGQDGHYETQQRDHGALTLGDSCG